MRRTVRVDKRKPTKILLRTMGQRFTICPDQEVQQYIQRLGSDCVPWFYATAAPGELSRSSFRFFAVKLRSPNAYAFPNGVIVIDVNLLRQLKNEAQLISVLAHEIAHVTHRHVFRDADRAARLDRRIDIVNQVVGWTPGMAFVLKATATGIICHRSRQSERQADRLALQYMVQAGYDPREAAQSFTVLGDSNRGWNPQDLFLSHATNQRRRAHIMALLSGSYRQCTFDNLRRNSTDFQSMCEALTGSTGRRGGGSQT